MRALAELSFDFVWHLMFTDDKQLDQIWRCARWKIFPITFR